jgi:alpha-ketoglutarate-dependent 2,4-dichlorophenoxyacetate dioxygenase
MELIPLGSDFGAEVRGLDVIDVAADDGAHQTARALFEEHSVLLFRDQQMSGEVLAAFARAFGPLERVMTGSPGQATVYGRTHNIAANGGLVAAGDRQVLTAPDNQLWHTDNSFKAAPSLASVLVARVIPTEGGETEFVSTRKAWSRLDAKMQEHLRDSIATHSCANSRDQLDPQLMTAVERKTLPPVRWRLTWQNPINGRLALYIASHAYAVDGMDEKEAKALLASLIADATCDEFVYRHQWRKGDVIMWDNRATMHRGRPWPLDQARSLIRTSILATDADGLAGIRPAAPRKGDALASTQSQRACPSISRA